MKVTDIGIRWFFLLSHTATCLAFWVFAPSTLMSFGASVASHAPMNVARATETNTHMLASLLVIAVPFALLEVAVLLWRHRREFAEAAPDISLNRSAISKDLAKIAVTFAISAALGAFGLYSVARGKWALADSFVSFLIATVICYFLIALIFEMAKYLPIVRSLVAR